MRTWELVDYDWDPETGLATITYERTSEDTGEAQTKIVKKEQKAGTPTRRKRTL